MPYINVILTIVQDILPQIQTEIRHFIRSYDDVVLKKINTDYAVCKR